MDIDLIIETEPAMGDVFAQLKPNTKKKILASLAKIRDMGLARRTHAFELGRYLTEIKEAMEADTPGLADRFEEAVGMRRSEYYRVLRTYERFREYEFYLPQIHVRVQRYFVDSRCNEQALEDVIALAKDGREISQDVFESEVLCNYIEDAQPANLLEDDDSDDDEGPEPEEEDIDEDVAGQRDSLIRAAFNSMGTMLRGIDDFCREKKVKKGSWYAKVNLGGESILEGLRAWQESEV